MVLTKSPRNRAVALIHPTNLGHSAMAYPLLVIFLVSHLCSLACSSSSTFSKLEHRIAHVRSAMLSSIRTSWEQGTASAAILEFDSPEHSVFGTCPFKPSCSHSFPLSALQLALSAVVRQGHDGRLSQDINDGLDGASLDGASAGPVVLLGTCTQPERREYWQKAADSQLQYILEKVPRASSGAISHRSDSKQYWADGVYVGFPFIAAYGAVSSNQTLLQLAYDQCKLYRDALLQPGPTGNLWAHIYSDDTQSFWDAGLWGTGNAWAAKGMLQIQVTILKSEFASNMTAQVDNLNYWIKEILDGTFTTLTPENLIPNYIAGNNATFGDASASAALASVAYRSATLFPNIFGCNYTDVASRIRDAVVDRIDEMGLLNPVVNPLHWEEVGVLSTEGQAFALMMFAAWRDWMMLSNVHT